MYGGDASTLAFYGIVVGLALVFAPYVDARQVGPATSGHAPTSKPTWHSRPPAHEAFLDDTTAWLPEPPPPPDTFDTSGDLQCVPYARFLSGILLRGNAWTWWDQAAGLYARGNRPEPGAVISFPGIDRMPLGHVAVVTQVLGARRILIDHANWPNAVIQHGLISHDIQVIDVSADNGWSEVRVQFGEGGPMGSVYPVNGFIYGWTEAGARIARPAFSLDYALWSPDEPTWQTFNAIHYVWALPAAERQHALAVAGVSPKSAPDRGRPMLVMGAPSAVPYAGAPAGPLAVNRPDFGAGARGWQAIERFVSR